MKEIKGDILKSDCDIIAITTNGIVKKNGELVMGAGVALQAKQRYPDLSKVLGDFVSKNGNVPDIVYCSNIDGMKILISLPTKHHWKDKSDIELIKKSLIIIKELISDIKNCQTIAIPRPGCANGGLDWETEVKPAIESILDDRFIVYNI